MKSTAVLGLALLLSVASAAATSLLLTSRLGTEPDSGGDERRAELDEIVRRQADLEARLAELRSALSSTNEAARSSPRSPAIDEREIERAVERVLGRREADSAVAKDDDEVADESRALAAAALLRELLRPGIDAAERARIWKALRDGGHVDAAIAEFERRASAEPDDSVAQTDLGWAYLQKVATTGGGPEAGRWGAKGAAALERALELDETNWDARFTLARHLADAEMLGDSVRHLERLIEQQGARAPEEKHAGAYLLLGSLHMNGGRAEAAKAVWRAGLIFFPGDEALIARLRSLD